MTDDILARADAWILGIREVGESADIIRVLAAEVRQLREKLALEVENNIAVGGLLKRFETERNTHIEELEKALRDKS